MKSKTIKSILTKKINAWLDSIKDEAVREIARNNVTVTGGAIVNMFLGEPVNDYDIYMRTPESLFAVCNYYLAEFKKTSTIKFRSGGDVEMYLADKNKRPVATFEKWQNSPDGGSERLRIKIQSVGVAAEGDQDTYEYFEGVPDAADAGAFVDQAAEKAEEAKKKDEGKDPFRPVFLTSNAITLSDGIQIVVRFFGDPAEVHKNFDFVHCLGYWTTWDRELVTRVDTLECIINKELRYVGSKYPLCSIFRMRKFLDRGWRINVGQILKACLQISKMDLSNIDTLEEQLIGVDQAYFTQVVRLCQERLEITKTDSVDHAYLVELIDKIF